MNGNNGNGGLMSFINDTITTCTMAGSRCGINTASPICNLDANGIACTSIHNGSPYAVTANCMQSGILTIGGTNVNYAQALFNGLQIQPVCSTLLMKCADTTELLEWRNLLLFFSMTNRHENKFFTSFRQGLM
jgi:hypothetical protein